MSMLVTGESHVDFSSHSGRDHHLQGSLRPEILERRLHGSSRCLVLDVLGPADPRHLSGDPEPWLGPEGPDVSAGPPLLR